MSQEQTHEQYVASTLEQFDAFVTQAVQACPLGVMRLTAADFRAARYELLKMMNERRMKSPADEVSSTSVTPDIPDPDAGQYLPVTPAPWP